MQIVVTQKHIARGIKGHPRGCPLAIAINEQCPAYEAAVCSYLLLVPLLEQNECFDIPLTTEAVSFFVDFDQGRLPLTHRTYVFDIPIPESCVAKSVERSPVLELAEVR